MKEFEKQQYTSLLVKGRLLDAMKYLETLGNQKELIKKYENVFVENMDLKRSTNSVINEIDSLYQAYYKDVFWFDKKLEIAEHKLFVGLWTYCGEKGNLEKNASIEAEVEKIVRKEGFKFLGGTTSGFYGPYIWETSNEVSYDVALPSGNEVCSIIFMEGFISRSWMDFLSFGKVGTGGWSGKDGRLYCVKSAYNLDSQSFKISYLKHEAQHAIDTRAFRHITNHELEYRAKLVELAYWEGDALIRAFHMASNNRDSKNSHSMASHRVISDLSRRLFCKAYVDDVGLFLKKLDDIRVVAKELLIEDTKRLSEQEAFFLTKCSRS